MPDGIDANEAIMMSICRKWERGEKRCEQKIKVVSRSNKTYKDCRLLMMVVQLLLLSFSSYFLYKECNKIDIRIFIAVNSFGSAFFSHTFR